MGEELINLKHHSNNIPWVVLHMIGNDKFV